MRRSLLTGSLALALLSFAAPPAQASFLPSGDVRYVDTYYESFCPNCGPEGEDVYYSDADTAQPIPPFSPFAVSVSAGSTWTASQDSSVSASLLAGTGRVASETGETGQAISAFDITFDVDVDTPFSLAGVLDSQSFTAALGVQLFRDASLLFAVDGSGFGQTPFSFAGVLAPGSYRLLVEAALYSASPGDEAGYSFSMSQVPEPGSLLLLALGAASLGVRSPRRAAQARAASR